MLVEAREAYLRCIALHNSDESDLGVRAHVGVAKLDIVSGEEWFSHAVYYIGSGAISLARAIREQEQHTDDLKMVYSI